MSNNTIRYVIYKDGSEVGSHTQNVMCRRCSALHSLHSRVMTI